MAVEKRKPPTPKPLQTKLSVAQRPLHQVAEAERKEIAQQVLDRYINGEQVASIAPDYKVSDVTIYALLLREHQDAWKDIQIARALARLEKAQDEMDRYQSMLTENREQTKSESGEIEKTPLDALSLARVRELIRLAEVRIKSAQWELERLLHRLYGQKQEVTQQSPVSITIGFSREQGVTIDGQKVDDAAQ